jgi:hypothetical protein
MAHAADDLLETDIDAYLDRHEHKSMLRFITCGSVDDGKSTLIGRLLYDSKLVFEDHLEALPHSGHGSLSLSSQAAHPPTTTSLTPHGWARRTLAP